MATKTTIIELRKMQVKDLRREIASQQMLIAKLHMGIVMKKEKDTARYVRERKQLARMKTALTEKMAEELSKSASDTTVPASKS